MNSNWFINLADARAKIERRRQEYNTERPLSELAYRSPLEFAALLGQAGGGYLSGGRVASFGQLGRSLSASGRTAQNAKIRATSRCVQLSFT